VVGPEVSLELNRATGGWFGLVRRGGLSAGACHGGYRSSRLTATVSRTEVMIENRIMSKQPGPPPNGPIWVRPRLIRGCSLDSRDSRSSGWLSGAGCVAWPDHAVQGSDTTW
jgi:hypothetical protein